MKPEAYLQVTFQEVIRITFLGKMCVRTSSDNYINANWICIWCTTKIWIGCSYNDIPTDLKAYFLSPQQFEEYKKLCEEFIGGAH